jgi:hypothetical protein
MSAKSLPVTVLLWMALAATPGARAEDAEKACLALKSVYATIDDATRCAQARGWEVHRYWVRIMDWQPSQDGEFVRVMCGAPSYTEENGRRNASWEVKSISRRYLGQSYRYSAETSTGRQQFKHFVDAGNAACGSLHLPRSAVRN